MILNSRLPVPETQGVGVWGAFRRIGPCHAAKSPSKGPFLRRPRMSHIKASVHTHTHTQPPCLVGVVGETLPNVDPKSN